MKLSINLLPPQPEVESARAKRKTVILFSGLLLIIFLLANFGIFGFYLLLTKNTADTLAAIKREEARITALAPTEKLYRALSAKLSFLAGLWQKKIKAEEAVEFAQALFEVPEVTLLKVSLKQDGLTTLSLKTVNSEGLERFLDGVVEKEKSGEIKGIKVISTNRNEDGGYDLSVSFEFLGTKK